VFIRAMDGEFWSPKGVKKIKGRESDMETKQLLFCSGKLEGQREQGVSKWKGGTLRDRKKRTFLGHCWNKCTGLESRSSEPKRGKRIFWSKGGQGSYA